MANMEHPSVSRVREALAEHGLTPEVRWFDDAATTAQAAADALGIEVGAIANSLVFDLDGEAVLVLTSGSHRVDTDWFGQKLGGTLTRASKELVRFSTGQVIGGVAPVGHPSRLRTYVDVALAKHPQVWAAAGHAHTVFPTTFEELVRMTGGEPTAVTPAG